MDDSNLRQPTRPQKVRGGLFILTGALLILLCALLYPAFQAESVQFSNDGPYGVISSDIWKLPQTFLGQWNDLNWLGNEDIAAPPNVTNLIRLTLGTLGFAKFNAFLTTLFAGLCGGLLFRVLGGNWWVCAMGGVAVAFNSNNFSNACWGLGSRPLCFGGALLALAMIASGLRGAWGWLKVALVGVGAGLSIMEGYDLGAILCVYIALYAVFVTFADAASDDEKNPKAAIGVGKRFFLAFTRVALIVAVTALTASYSLSSLYQTQVKGVGVFEEKEDPVQRWDFATQWSLPKAETFRLFIPGIQGYRMDSPNGQEYWGSVGETPGYKAGGMGMARFSGSGEYAGLLVILIASWAVAHIWRRKDNPFSTMEMRSIKFWSIVGLASLLLAYGRHAPFYQLVYMTPVFGMFRNPIKYLVPFHISILILFAYALIGLCRAYMQPPINSGVSLKKTDTQKKWGEALAIGWRTLSSFDKKWIWGVLIWTGLSIFGLLFFISSGDKLVEYMQKTGITAQVANVTLGASVWEILVYIALLMLGMVVMAFFLGRQLSQKQVVILCGISLLLLMGDFYRSNCPWVVFYNYQERLQKDALLEFLTDKPKTERVTFIPSSDDLSKYLSQLYSVEWMQQEFPHYNISTLESWMEPRKLMDKIIFQSAFATNTIRYWEMTGARYILGVKGFAEVLNKAWDPEKKRFSERTYFDFQSVPAPRYALSVPSENGPYTVIDFAGAIPRLALYSHWETMASDQTVLQRLSDKKFDPEQTVLVDAITATEAELPLCGNTAEPFTRLEYETYSPLKFSVQLKGVTKDSILLINDRFNPKWHAYVDGKQVEVLRCNYIGRGIRIPAGDHQVEMRFEQNTFFFYVSLLAMVIGLPTVFILLRKGNRKEISV